MVYQDQSFLFVFPPSRSDYRFLFHLGTGYIQAFLYERGIGSYQYVPPKRVTLPLIVEDIIERDPEFVGFTCYDSNYYIVKSIAWLLKKKKPDIPLVVGGPTATFSDKFILEDCPDIDMCVRGEGEETTYELVKKGTSDLRSIQGVTFRDGKSSIVRTEDRPLIKSEKRGAELDILPSPYIREMLPLDGQAGILTSRGCTYRCTFCNFSIMSRHTIRYHSIERVITELGKMDDYINNALARHEKGVIQFNDDTFSLNTDRAKEICRRIIDEGIDLRFYADTRADFCDLELLELMYKAGFREVNFGLESAVPRILRNVKKIYAGDKWANFEPEKKFLQTLKENVRLAKKLGFYVSVSTILGLPGETPEDAIETLRFIKELGVDEYSHNYLKIHSGTELFRTHKKYSLSIDKSCTILPLQTTYPYNFYGLQPLPHASLHKSIIDDEQTYLELLANSSKRDEKNLWVSMFVDEKPEKEELCSWMAQVATIPFSLYMRNCPSIEFASSYINWLVRHNIPLGNFYFLKPSKTSFYELTRFSESTWPHCSFIEDSLSNCRKYRTISKRTKLILTCTTKEDIKTLSQLMKEAIRSGFLTLNSPLAGFCAIRDECRWANERCPALDVNRLVVRGDGSVLPCFNGGSVGNIVSSREEIEQNLKTIWQTETERRECHDCLLKNRCSMCLFPYPFTTEEYCTFRQTHPEIGDYIDLLRTTRVLLREGSPLGGSKTRSVSMQIKAQEKGVSGMTPSLHFEEIPEAKEEIRVIIADKVSYAVNRKSQSIYKLSKPAAQILEALIYGLNIENLVRQLCVGYRKDRSEILYYIQKTFKLFGEKGFLVDSCKP